MSMHIVPARMKINESEHEARQFFWEPNEWTSDPGTTCPPLDPPGSAIVKTLPPSKVSVFTQDLPPLQDEVKCLNESYLEVTTGLASNKWLAVLPAIFLVMLVLFGAPCLLWIIFIEENFLENLGINLILLVAIPIISIMSYDLFGVVFLSPEDEPIRFCRHEQKVYRYQARRWRWLGMSVYRGGKPEIKVEDWSKCRAEVVRTLVTSGSSARTDCFLELAVLDPQTQKVTERFRVGDRDVYSDFSKRIFLWETIRRFMEEGTVRVPPPVLQAHRGTLLDCIEDFNPFSVPAKSSPGAQRIFGYFFAALLLVASLLFSLMVLSRWIAIKTARKVDWGELEHTAFRIAPDDPALQRSLQPEIAAPQLWAAELRRRRQAACAWLAVIVLQLGAVWWYLSTPSYY